MELDQLQRLTRNVIAAMIHIDPIDIYPDQTRQADQRIRFRQAPHFEFLKADDLTQRRITELMLEQIGPALK